jgi:hypothetical protein
MLLNEQFLSVHQRDLSTILLPILVGRVFHVTTPEAFANLLAEGMIKTNENGDFAFTFGQSANSYFRRRGCVSVFDLRSVTSAQSEDSLRKYYFLTTWFTTNKPVFLCLNSTGFERLIPWIRWKEEEAYHEMVIPYVEAGYPGDIPIDLIDAAVRVEVDNPPSPLDLALKTAREKAR